MELTCFLTSSERQNMPFRLSGEVVNDRVLPMPGCEEGLVDTISDNAQVVAAGVLSSMSNSSHNHREDTNNDIPIQFCWRPSSSPNDCGVDGGSMALAHMIRSFISNQRPSLVVTPDHLKDVWENKLTCENKEKIANAIVQKLGALHGRRVVCEGRYALSLFVKCIWQEYVFLSSCSSCCGILTFGILLFNTRLNFDYDIRRGTEEGPWIDAIPFDGRDVWQFTLVADDSLENMWRADPASFVNLGPAHRPRCWPWSNDVELPYGRSGADKDLRGPGPNGKRYGISFDFFVGTCIFI